MPFQRSARRAVAIAAMTCLPPAAVGAAEAQIGLGWCGLDRGDGAVTGVVEVASGPFLAYGPADLRVGAAASLDADGDAWVGAGPIVVLGFAGLWRLEGSLMPGVYERGSGDDLGGSLQFRSKLAVSRSLAETHRIGLAFTHVSNGGIESRNPGEDAVLVFVSTSL